MNIIKRLLLIYFLLSIFIYGVSKGKRYGIEIDIYKNSSITKIYLNLDYAFKKKQTIEKPIST